MNEDVVHNFQVISFCGSNPLAFHNTLPQALQKQVSRNTGNFTQKNELAKGFCRHLESREEAATENGASLMTFF